MYTKALLLAEVRELLNEPVSMLWLDSELNDMIDWAARTMSGITLCTQATEVIETLEDVYAYPLANQYIKVESVIYSDTTGLQRLDIRNFGHGAAGGTATNQTPKWYYVFGNTLHLWPTPKGTYVGNNIDVYGYRVAEDYEHGSTVYDVPDRLQGKLIDFVLATAYVKAGKYSLTRKYMQRFLQSAIIDRKDIHENRVAVDSLDRFLIPDRTVVAGQQQ
jgi:hypothetical protein